MSPSPLRSKTVNALETAREDAYRTRVLEALRWSAWDVTQAAAVLGVHRTYLHTLIRRFKLVRPIRVVGTGENAGKRLVVDLLLVGTENVAVRLPNGTEVRFDRATGKPIVGFEAPWRLDRTVRLPADVPAQREAG